MSTHLLDVDRVRIGVGGGVLFVVNSALVATAVPTPVFVAVLVVATVVVASTVALPGALLLGLTGWALSTGFGVNQLGQLTFAPHDLLRLLVYVGSAAVLGGARGPAQ